MPCLHHAVLGTLRRDGSPVELARQADGEIADVDHLLYLAETFGEDLARLDRDERAKVGLGSAQFVAEQSHQLAPPRGRHVAPARKRRGCPRDRGRRLRRTRLGEPGEHFSRDGRAYRKRAPAQDRLRHAEALQDHGRLAAERGRIARGYIHGVRACQVPWSIAGLDLANTFPNRLSRNVRNRTSSWRTKPRCGRAPSASRSSMAQTAEAVVTWIAVNILPPMSRL